MRTTRRELLAMGAGLGSVNAFPAAASEQTAGHGLDLRSAHWGQIRQLFRFQGQAPLNAANLCPAFAQVLDLHRDLEARLSADVGFINRREVVHQEFKRAREESAALLGLNDSSSLALVRNTTEANAVIVNALDLQAEDEVVLWRENHASNYRSWHYRHQRNPFRVKPLSLDAAADDDAIVAAFVAALSPKTRVVSFSHISNISGTRLPAKAICQAIHLHNPEILVHVDGAQAWGSAALDLDDMECDAYSSSAHKWLCGPRGVGVLMVQARWAERLQPLILGYDANFDFPEQALPKTAQRFECLGQRDTAAIAALGLAADLHEKIGPARIEARIDELTRYAMEAFEEAGIAVITPRRAGRGHGVVVADLGGRHKSYGAFLALHNAGYAAAFVHANRVHCSPTGVPQSQETPVYLRICPHIYNSTDDIDAAVAIAKRIRHSNFEIIKEVVRFF